VTPTDMTDAVRTFLEFLALAEYPNPVRLVTIRDPKAHVGLAPAYLEINVGSLEAVLYDFEEWLRRA
jgi:hypothetical protein